MNFSNIQAQQNGYLTNCHIDRTLVYTLSCRHKMYLWSHVLGLWCVYLWRMQNTLIN